MSSTLTRISQTTPFIKEGFGQMTNDGFRANPKYAELEASMPTAALDDGRWQLQIDESICKMLPPAVLYNSGLDVLQGARYKTWRSCLMQQGMSKAEAEAKLYPNPEHGGQHYLQVWFRCLSEIVSPIMGGTAGPWTEHHESFARQLYLYRVLLGLSTANGGGPGVMAASSRITSGWERIIASLDYRRICESSKVVQVFLHIQKEAPNGYGTPGYMAWPIDWLESRGAMLFSWPNVDSFLISGGGFGTDVEKYSIIVGDQLMNHIVTSANSRRPIIFLDFPMFDGNMWFDADFDSIEKRRAYGTIATDHVKRFKRVNIAGDTAARRVFAVQVDSIREMIGIDAIQWWEERNEKDFFETADGIFSEFEPQLSPPAFISPNVQPQDIEPVVYSI